MKFVAVFMSDDNEILGVCDAEHYKMIKLATELMDGVLLGGETDADFIPIYGEVLEFWGKDNIYAVISKYYN